MKNVLILFFVLSVVSYSRGQSVASSQVQVDSIYNTVPDSLDEGPAYDFLINHLIELRSKDVELARDLVDEILLDCDSKGLAMQHARALGYSGMIYGLEGKEEQLLDSYLKSINEYQQLLEDPEFDTSFARVISSNISVCYNNLAQVYLDREEYDLALNFYMNSLTEAIRTGDSLDISIRAYNIGTVHLNINQFDSAFYYMEWSKKLEEGMNSPEGLAYAYEGLARIYNAKGDYLEAIRSVDSSLYFLSISQDKIFEVEILIFKSEVLVSIGGIEEAINVLLKAEGVASSVGYKKLQFNAIRELAILYEEVEQIEKAFFYIKKQLELQEEIEDEESQKKIEEYMVQYKSEQKDKEIVQLALQNKLKEEANQNLLDKTKAEESKRRIIYWSFGGGILMLTAIGLLLFIDSRRRKRINHFLKKNNESLARKNDQILHQSKLIKDSINYAQNIQKAILPTSKEMNDEFEDHFVFFLPKDVVSGDFYWMYKIPESNKVLFSVADCTGHGVPGAFMSIVGHALLEKIAKQLNIYPPNQILNQLAFELQNTLKKGEGAVDDGMDIALVMIDYDANKLHFAGARNPLVFISENELKLIKGDRIDLGKQLNVDFKETIVDFKKGDKIYMFTDGFIDQKGGSESKKYYSVRFRDYIEQISSYDMSDQKQAIWSEFDNWKGNHEQMDDILVVGLRL